VTRATPLVFVTGPPASGKTHIAGLLAAELPLPLVAKDEFKEVLYDSLGIGDVAWSQRLGAASIALVYQAIEAHLRAGQPLVVEANFVAEQARPTLLRLQARHAFESLEVHCSAREDVLVARYESRAGTRHAGHLDAERVDEISAAIRDGRNGPLDLGGSSIVFDTTDLDRIDLEGVLATVRRHVEAR
jgi:predicted kinase